MSEPDTTVARQRFRQLVNEHWAAVNAGQPEEAERTSQELDRLVRQTVDSNQIDFLRNLLGEEETAAVRESAATFTLQYGYVTEAVPVLEEIANTDGIGLVAEDAEMVLTERRDQG